MEENPELSLSVSENISQIRSKLFVPSLLILGFLLRLFWVYKSKVPTENLWSDMKGYAAISRDLMNGVWSENHFFQSIGYPLFISVFKFIPIHWGITLGYFQALLSGVTLLLIYKTAQINFNEKVARVTLLISALHLPWILFNTVVLPETVFTFFMALLSWLTSLIIYRDEHRTKYLFAWGVVFILGFYLKGTHSLLAPLFIAAYSYWKRNLTVAVPIISVLLLGFGLHGALTKQKIGKVQLSASTGGLNFIEGKCPQKKNSDSRNYTWHSPLYHQLDMHEKKVWPRPFTDSGYYMKEGFKCIQEDPSVLLQSFEAITFLFIGNTLWPFNQFPVSGPLRLYEHLFAVFSLTGLIFFGFYLFKSKSPKLLMAWGLPVLSLFLCVYIFKSEMRYRIPFDVWIIPMCVQGWITFLENQKRSSHVSLSGGTVL